MASTYFLAASDAAAAEWAQRLEELDGPDQVDAHQMITVPHLSALVDVAEGRPVGVDLSMVSQVWPPMPDDPQADLSWMGEPIVERLDDALRDRLATVDLASLSEWIQEWAAEVSGAVTLEACEPLARELILLARRAQGRPVGLYNRYEL